MKHLFMLLFLLLPFCVFSQNKSTNQKSITTKNNNFNSVNTNLIKINIQQKYSEAQIETFVREVFKDHADELVLKSTSRRLEIIKGFLNRFEIVERGDLRGKKIELLSTIPLSNKYNSNLTRDTFVNPNTFNPLKYNFEMTPKEIQLFRIDNTDFIIRILPIN